MEDIRGYFCRLIEGRGGKPNGASPSQSSCLVIDAEVLDLFVKAPDVVAGQVEGEENTPWQDR